MLRKLGFFHYGDEQSDPSGSLRAAIAEASQQEDLSDCLLVVPEAFNIRNGYFTSNCYRDPSIKDALVQISLEFKVAFVAGLVEEGDSGELGYSAAYLIDESVCQCLSLKAVRDKSPSYKAFCGGWDKPILHRGISIAALICFDAVDYDSPRKERHNAVVEQASAFSVPHAVLCVPARMVTYGSKEVALAWPANFTVVVGNTGCSQPSVIRRAGERVGVEPICFKEARNTARVVALA